MTAPWKKVYSTENGIQAELIRGLLENNEIRAVIVNKRDSQYNDFGDVEIHVPTNKVLTAIKIIQDVIDSE